MLRLPLAALFPFRFCISIQRFPFGHILSGGEQIGFAAGPAEFRGPGCVQRELPFQLPSGLIAAGNPERRAPKLVGQWQEVKRWRQAKLSSFSLESLEWLIQSTPPSTVSGQNISTPTDSGALFSIACYLWER